MQSLIGILDNLLAVPAPCFCKDSSDAPWAHETVPWTHLWGVMIFWLERECQHDTVHRIILCSIAWTVSMSLKDSPKKRAFEARILIPFTRHAKLDELYRTLLPKFIPGLCTFDQRAQ